MRLWTVQPLSALEELKQTGVYRCRREKSFNLTKRDSLEKPYQWLIQRMKEKIGQPPEGVTYPVWAWHTWEFARRAPDADSAAFLRRTEDKVLFTLEIPESQVTLTDFDAWQLVLQNMYVADKRTEAEFAALQEKLEELPADELAAAIEASWDHVFLIDPVDTDVLTRGKFVQATFWEIKPEYVVQADVLPREAP
ncbi:MAG: DUF3841 domain-containing protein [Clostridia bacterium]|nr:DUF3841 domain-containing protein [Clostridia bacterium]